MVFSKVSDRSPFSFFEPRILKRSLMIITSNEATGRDH